MTGDRWVSCAAVEGIMDASLVDTRRRTNDFRMTSLGHLLSAGRLNQTVPSCSGAFVTRRTKLRVLGCCIYTCLINKNLRHTFNDLITALLHFPGCS